jgi:competence protein ComEC
MQAMARLHRVGKRSALAGIVLLAILTVATACQPVGLPPAVQPPGTSAPTLSPGQQLTVLFLDVGQGDAALVRSPAGRTLLIDGGDSQDDAARVILPALREWGCRQLDMLVITHPDQDHIGGLPYLVESFPVNQVVLTGQVHTTATYEQLLTLIRDKTIPAIKARRGGMLNLDAAVSLAILGPDNAAVERDDTNNASVVLRLTYGTVSILFTGDAEEPEEEAILANWPDVHAQVLKVAHHGSRSASSPAWLRAVSPEVAVISVAAGSPYTHPHPEVLNRLIQAGTTIYRTDQHGTVTVLSDGRAYQIFTEH